MTPARLAEIVWFHNEGGYNNLVVITELLIALREAQEWRAHHEKCVEQHGPQFYPLSHTLPGTQILPDKDAEIAHLRAEMERLCRDHEAEMVKIVQAREHAITRADKAEAVVQAAEEIEQAWIDKVDRGIITLKVIALGDVLAAYRGGA